MLQTLRSENRQLQRNSKTLACSAAVLQCGSILEYGDFERLQQPVQQRNHHVSVLDISGRTSTGDKQEIAAEAYFGPCVELWNKTPAGEHRDRVRVEFRFLCFGSSLGGSRDLVTGMLVRLMFCKAGNVLV